jgi:hypothetical protein
MFPRLTPLSLQQGGAQAVKGKAKKKLTRFEQEQR